MDLNIHVEQLKKAKRELQIHLLQSIQEVVSEFEKNFGVTPSDIHVCMLDRSEFGERKRYMVASVEVVLY